MQLHGIRCIFNLIYGVSVHVDVTASLQLHSVGSHYHKSGRMIIEMAF